MSNYLDYASRRGLIERGNVCDDFREMFGGYSPQPLRNNITNDIKKVGENNSIQLEVYFIPFYNRHYIFATNRKGFRWLFLTIQTIDGGTKGLSSGTVGEVRRIFYCSQHQKRFFKELREKRFEAKRKRDRSLWKETEYIAGQYKRVFQGLGRTFGVNSGKTRMPFGRTGWLRPRRKAI